MTDGDKEFIYETLENIMRLSDHQALRDTVEALASELGVSQLNGMPIREFYERQQRVYAEHHISDSADLNMRLGSYVKEAWIKADEERKRRESEDL